jgi:putative transposase
MADSRYAKNAGAVFSLKDHIVWCPKYRRAGPSGRHRLKALLKDIASDHHRRSTRGDAWPRSPVRRSGADAGELVARFKGRTSHGLRQESAHLRSRPPTLWSRGCFAGTVGNVSAGKTLADRRHRCDGGADLDRDVAAGMVVHHRAFGFGPGAGPRSAGGLRPRLPWKPPAWAGGRSPLRSAEAMRPRFTQPSGLLPRTLALTAVFSRERAVSADPEAGGRIDTPAPGIGLSRVLWR